LQDLADHIKALTAENDALRSSSPTSQELLQLREENRRLREALEELSSMIGSTLHFRQPDFDKDLHPVTSTVYVPPTVIGDPKGPGSAQPMDDSKE
jgi:hypothetical protein